MAREPKTKTAGRKPSARALKVYSMPAGFFDAVISAPSQKAALKAWGTTTDLFAAGRAFIVEDAAIKAEALARPGEIIRRSRGDEAAMLGPKPAASQTSGPKKTASRAKSPPKPKLPPDRSRLDAAEQALAAAKQQHAAELDALDRERDELDRRERELRRTGAERLKALSDAVDVAASAFRKAQDRE